MKIFSAVQIRQWDHFTIQQEPISSYALMERASNRFVQWLSSKYPRTDRQICIFCGSGNNGGDGFAVARLLHQLFYKVIVFQCEIGEASPDCARNAQQLKDLKSITWHPIRKDDPLPALSRDCLVIDALFGSGLNRPIEGYWAALVNHINASSEEIVAIDIPSGLYSDRSSLDQVTIKAQATLSFERPKLAFFFPQNYRAVGEWSYTTIGLHPGFEAQIPSRYHLITRTYVQGKLRVRKKFDHKGTNGHALLVVGSYGKIGAGVLAARACLRMGVGLLSINAPQCGYNILQSQVPEAMVLADPDEKFWSKAPNVDTYKAIGIGCGLGQAESSKQALVDLLTSTKRPIVLDADALNIISQHPAYLDKIPKNSILTPHQKEFQRLFGETTDDFARLALLQAKAQEHQLVILLKGAHTIIALPNGDCFFNNTGNSGMATGGSGDVLTGMITSLLAQGYPPPDATLIGVYMHGKSGDLAAQEWSESALLPSDLINYIGEVFLSLKT